MVEHQSTESESLASHGDSELFSLFQARDMTKRHLSLLHYRTKNLPSFLFYLLLEVNKYRVLTANFRRYILNVLNSSLHAHHLFLCLRERRYHT